MSSTEPATDRAPEVDRPVRWRWWLVVPLVAVLAATSGAILLAGPGSDDGATHPIATAEPLDLTTVAVQTADHYRYARDHQEQYAQIPCFCGCEEFLAHESLYDCFLRADGLGYDSHAAGCAVCLGESMTASRLLDQGVPAAEVAQRVIEEFGTTPTTSPSQTIPPT